MAYSRKFGELVKEHLAGRDYREVAGKLRLHYTTLYNYARGQAPREIEPVRRLAELLELPPDEEKRLLSAAEAMDPDVAIDRLLDADPQELTYEPDLENVRAEGIEGRVPAEDVEKANRIFRSIISEMARRQGRE